MRGTNNRTYDVIAGRRSIMENDLLCVYEQGDPIIVVEEITAQLRELRCGEASQVVVQDKQTVAARLF